VDQEQEERDRRRQRPQRDSELRAGDAAAGDCVERVEVLAFARGLTQCQRARPEHRVVGVEPGEHQPGIERDHDQRQRGAERLVLKDHRPGGGADVDRDHHEESQRHERPGDDQRTRHQLDRHRDVEQMSVG